MITFFTTAKPFTGHNGIIQRNALKSWTLAAPNAEVILFGDEAGAVEAARELGITHVAEVERVPEGPKKLRSFFDAAQKMARYDTLCYANCDIVLMEDFASAVKKAAGAEKQFLMVGRRWDTDVTEPIPFQEPDWKERLREKARAHAAQRSGDWIDYFAFRKGFYLGKMPDLVIGRVFWDQWLVWKARELGGAVVDASEAVMAIHQNHDYGYHPAGKTGVWTDELSQRNHDLAGGRWHLRTIDDATHVLGADELRKKPGRARRAVARSLETAKNAMWMTAMNWTRPLRKAVGLRKSSPAQRESESPSGKSSS
ncbi:MAG TPA: hypothetical protein VIW23_10195 [Candidatus Acidoferrum sp.]